MLGYFQSYLENLSSALIDLKLTHEKNREKNLYKDKASGLSKWVFHWSSNAEVLTEGQAAASKSWLTVLTFIISRHSKSALY